MSDKYFLDTNILFYSFSSSEKNKQATSQKLISEGLSSGKGTISYQVVQEFLNVALTKFSVPMSKEEAQIYLNFVLLPLCTLHSSFSLFDQAIGIKVGYKFSFYDSLVVASALAAGCKTLYSEDLQHGQNVMGLEVVNPFR